LNLNEYNGRRLSIKWSSFWKGIHPQSAMDLLKDIKVHRARQRKRQSFERKVDNTVGCIVKAYGLGRGFLKRLDGMEDQPSPKVRKPLEVKVKTPLDLPPYLLLSREEYELVVTILSKLNNPYLLFARTPEEMLLSSYLYESNPSLESRQLLRHDFETLLLCEGTKKELAALERRATDPNGTASLDGRCHKKDEDSRPVRSARERINQLQAFIARVEHTELKTE
jgi:hypothetical protein